MKKLTKTQNKILEMMQECPLVVNYGIRGGISYTVADRRVYNSTFYNLLESGAIQPNNDVLFGDRTQTYSPALVGVSD